MTACAICSKTSPDRIGVLCRACAAGIAGETPRAPGIVASRAAGPAAAWLIDSWGQVHAVGTRCRVGRDAERNDLVVADLGVSSEHAELRADREGWCARDRGSSNGTSVADRPRALEARLTHREAVWFGTVGFYFWDAADPPARQVPPPDVRTLVPDGAAFRLTAPDGGELIVRAVRGHPLHRAPGDVEYRREGAKRAARAALPRLQFQLLRALCEAAIQQQADERAGFVGTHELVATLPFQTARPEPNHVRQVVSSLRATLERAGVARGDDHGAEGLVHASEGLGYRVTWAVERLTGRTGA